MGLKEVMDKIKKATEGAGKDTGGASDSAPGGGIVTLPEVLSMDKDELLEAADCGKFSTYCCLDTEMVDVIAHIINVYGSKFAKQLIKRACKLCAPGKPTTTVTTKTDIPTTTEDKPKLKETCPTLPDSSKAGGL